MWCWVLGEGASVGVLVDRRLGIQDGSKDAGGCEGGRDAQRRVAIARKDAGGGKMVMSGFVARDVAED